MSATELFQARQALAAGDRTAARAILGGLVQRNLADAEVWLLLSQTVDAVAHKRDCLQRALQADPASAAAQQALDALDAPRYIASAPVSPPAAPPISQWAEAAPPPAPVPATQAGWTPPARPEPPQKSRLATVLVGIGSGLVLGALLIGAIVVLRDQSTSAGTANSESQPTSTSRASTPTPSPDFSAPGGTYGGPIDPDQPTNTPLPDDEIPASLLIDELVAFEHPQTGISGLRPKNWTLFSGPTSFQISTSPEAPDGFIGAILPADQFVGGSAEQTTKSSFAEMKKNSAAGPAPVIIEETYNKDGSGVILVESTQTAQGSTAPIRFTIYARTTVTADGLLLALATVPAEMFPAEEAFVRQMVDSLSIK
jgi:hypothetical protein